MSNKKQDKQVETTTTVEEKAPEVVAEKATEGVAVAPTQSTALAQMTPVEALAERLPARYRDDVILMVRPTPTQLAGIVRALPENEQQKMLDLIRKLNPKKQGAHTERTGFSPTVVKINQGTGTDPLRPADLPAGHYYTSDSRSLGKKFEGAVLGFYEGRILWPPQGEKGSDSSNSKVPLCVSMDRMKGSRYGECTSCPKAGMQYNQGGCARDVVVFLVDKAMTGIYELHYSKTSESSGNALVKIISKSESLWDRWISFTAEERKEDSRRWFVQKAAPMTEGEMATPKTLHPLFEELSKIVDFDVFYSGLANIYDRAKNSHEAGLGGAGEQANTANESSLGLTDAPADYSGSGSGNV